MANKSNLEIYKKSFDVLQPDLYSLFEEKIDEYGISKTKALILLNIDIGTFDEILKGNAKNPTLFNIIKIADFLNIKVQDLISVILSKQTPDVIRFLERPKKISFIGENFDLKRLVKAGFLDDTDDIDYINSRILSFFGYSNIDDYEKELDAPLFSKTKRKFSDKMKSFWITSAYLCFKKIDNPNAYDREALKDLISKIKPYCQDVENGLLTVCKALYNVGVTVLVQNHLTLTQVRGGTFVVNGKPCIVLTDLNKRYTTIWETLIHELYHVVFDLDDIKDKGYHITGEPDLFLLEEKADDFSREYFCGLEKYNFIKPLINNHGLVNKYAKDWEINPSFIYSSFRFFEDKLNGRNYYAAYIDYFPNSSLAIKKLNPITWKEGSINEVADSLKTIFELNLVDNGK